MQICEYTVHEIANMRVPKEVEGLVNVIRLRNALEKCEISYEDAARAIGVNRSTFYRRVQREGSKFTVEEVEKLSSLLRLSSQEMQAIFFDRELA